MPSSKLKASDRQAIFKKLATALKKKYGGSVPKHKYNVLDTMLLACCLENSTYEDAQAAYEQLLETFDDLNVIRVSSVSEIEGGLGEIDEAAWKALRIRETLHYVFEKHYAFDFEPLRRKTMDAAEKELQQIRYLSPFVRNYTLQHSLESHVVPLDDVQTEILIWLGFLAPETTPEKASEEIKSSLRKNDVALMCHLLRQLGTDKKYKGTFKLAKSDGEIDLQDAPARLEKHLKSPARKKVTRTRKKPAAAARKSKTATKSAGKKTSKKVTRKKPAAKKKTKRPARKK